MNLAGKSAIVTGADRGGKGTENASASQVADGIRAAGGAAAPCFLPVDDYQAAGEKAGYRSTANRWKPRRC
jgi:hypothetical protein